MKTNIHFWSYLAQFFLKWEVFQAKNYRENRNTHFMFNHVFRKSCCLWDNVKKNFAEPDRKLLTIWRMRIACWIPKATNSPSHYVIMLFRYNSGCRNSPQCYLISTLLALLAYKFGQLLTQQFRGVPWLRRSVAGLSPRRSVFDFRLAHVGLLVESLAQA